MELISEEKEAPEKNSGVSLSSIKRRPHHFCGLPLLATIRVECDELDEALDFVARSPLAGKQELTKAPPPFWCVLEADKEDGPEQINMEVRIAKMEYDTVRPSIAGMPRKKQKATGMAIRFPVLVNSKPLKENDVLVMPHGTKFFLNDYDKDEDEDEDEEEDEDSGGAAKGKAKARGKAKAAGKAAVAKGKAKAKGRGRGRGSG